MHKIQQYKYCSYSSERRTEKKKPAVSGPGRSTTEGKVPSGRRRDLARPQTLSPLRRVGTGDASDRQGHERSGRAGRQVPDSLRGKARAAARSPGRGQEAKHAWAKLGQPTWDSKEQRSGRAIPGIERASRPPGTRRPMASNWAGPGDNVTGRSCLDPRNSSGTRTRAEHVCPLARARAISFFFWIGAIGSDLFRAWTRYEEKSDLAAFASTFLAIGSQIEYDRTLRKVVNRAE
jgi:hypothetical protein